MPGEVVELYYNPVDPQVAEKESIGLQEGLLQN